MIDNQIKYTAQENLIWKKTYNKQIRLLENRVYENFWNLLDEIQLPKDKVPQLFEVSRILRDKIGWSIAEVSTGLEFKDYMYLLSNKIFPSTIYLRKSIGFTQDPDIFHEIFGHIPMLLDINYSNFLHRLAKIALKCSALEQVFIKRIFWFTVEVGLIQTNKGLKVYGASLISSPQELVYSLEKNESEKKAFNLLDIIRTPYRSDELQKTYYIIDSLDILYNLDFSPSTLYALAKAAVELGEYPARFKVEVNKYTSADCF